MQQQIIKEIKTIMEGKGHDVENINEDQELVNEADFDSLDLIEVLQATESHFNVYGLTDDPYLPKTIRDIAISVEAKLGHS